MVRTKELGVVDRFFTSISTSKLGIMAFLYLGLHMVIFINPISINHIAVLIIVGLIVLFNRANSRGFTFKLNKDGVEASQQIDPEKGEHYTNRETGEHYVDKSTDSTPGK